MTSRACADARRESRARRTLALFLGFMLIGSLPGAAASIEPANPAHPRVSDGLLTFDADQLSANSTPFLSGLRDNTLIASYEGTNGEILNCTDAFVQISVNSTSPAQSLHRAPLSCDANVPAPAFSQTFRGALPAHVLKQTPPGSSVRFQIGILVLPTTVHVDDNDGRFYRYRVDNTAPRLADWYPLSHDSEQGPWGASNDPRTPFSFRVLDDVNQSALASVRVSIDGSDLTDSFDCVIVASHERRCAFDYGTGPMDFRWTTGEHQVFVSAADATGNRPLGRNATYLLRIDEAAPAIDSIQAHPLTSWGGNDGLPVTARGVGVNVLARVDDPSLDTSSQDVVAQLISEDGALRSPHAVMRYNQSNGLWQADPIVVPMDWPARALGVRVRITATDAGGNIASMDSPSALLRLDPEPPSLVLIDPPSVIGGSGLKVRAAVTDDGSGVDPDSVMLRFLTIEGNASAALANANATYREAKMGRMADGSYSGLAAAGPDGSLMGYYVVARDGAGGEARTQTLVTPVDATPPTLVEVDPRPYRNASAQQFSVLATDAAAGLEAASVTLHYGFGSDFHPVPMRINPDGVHRVLVDLHARDGQRVQYYFSAADLAGNVGRSGQGAPSVFEVDAVAPTLAITAPARTEGEAFLVTWRGLDDASGIANQRIQVRIAQGDWFPLADGAAPTSVSICPPGPSQVEIRGAATDRAGNAAPMPPSAQATVSVRGKGCEPRLILEAVALGERGAANATLKGPQRLTWHAFSPGSNVPESAIRIDVDFSPDAGGHYLPFRTDLANTGALSFSTSMLDNCDACVFRVRASDFTGAAAAASSPIFSNHEGDPSLDRDGNGLPDAWELQHASDLGVLSGDDDVDSDGLSNLQESRIGTNPWLADTDGDGATDGAEFYAGTDATQAASAKSVNPEEASTFSPLYWILPFSFVAVGTVYLSGRARRW